MLNPFMIFSFIFGSDRAGPGLQNITFSGSGRGHVVFSFLKFIYLLYSTLQ